MLSTKHTSAVGENIFQHLWFCIKVSAKLQLAILCFMLHGLSCGLWNAPGCMQIDEISKWISDLACKR